MGGDMENVLRSDCAANNKYEVIVNPNAGDDTICMADVVRWSPFHVKIYLWDPDMLLYGSLMKNKAQREERDAFVYNAKRMFERTEKLGNEAVYNLLLKEQSKQRQIRMAMVLVASIWLIFAISHPLIAVGLTVIHIMLFFAILNRQSAATKKLHEFFTYREESFEQRMNDYLNNTLKTHAMIL